MKHPTLSTTTTHTPPPHQNCGRYHYSVGHPFQKCGRYHLDLSFPPDRWRPSTPKRSLPPRRLRFPPLHFPSRSPLRRAVLSPSHGTTGGRCRQSCSRSSTEKHLAPVIGRLSIFWILCVCHQIFKSAPYSAAPRVYCTIALLTS